MHEQHKVICVTIFGTTDWLARTTFFIIALLSFTLSEDAAIQYEALSPAYVIRAIAHFPRLSKFLSILFLVQK